MFTHPSTPALCRVHRKGWLIGLLLAAIFVRALVPQGFMPNFGNGVQLALCTSSGAVTLNINEPSLPHAPQAHQECPFAFALGMAAALPFSGGFSIDNSKQQAPRLLAALHLPTVAPAYYAARGPPVLI